MALLIESSEDYSWWTVDGAERVVRTTAGGL